MISTLLGLKQGRSQEFTPEGRRVPVTYITVGPCYVTRIEKLINSQKIQLGFSETKKINQPISGLIKKAGISKKLRFFRTVDLTGGNDDLKVGQKINAAEVFKTGDKVRVTGISKGKGFTGVVKRHGFRGGPRTHGQSDRERAPGSIGQTTTPGRVYKGKRMAGRAGGKKVTIKGLQIISVDGENNLLKLTGMVPGADKGLLIISKMV